MRIKVKKTERFALVKQKKEAANRGKTASH
jgi:hypothetical protein